MENFTKIYGIDVSKDSLDIAVLNGKGQQEQMLEIKNDLKCIVKWINTIEQGAFCVLEATGSYSTKLTYSLAQGEIEFALVNPNRSKSYMDAIGLYNKTDRSAALSLAKMGYQLQLQPYVMPSQKRQEQKQLYTALRALRKQRQMLVNQLHALDQHPTVIAAAKAAYEQTLAMVDQQIEQLQQELSEQDEEPEVQQIQERICSVKGIGACTAQAILLATNDLRGFDSADQLACFLGLTPKTHYSGSSIRKSGHISKQGANQVRELLYMCARSAVRFNIACRALYQRLRAKGKPHKVAMVAVMHKLVKQLFACVKKQVMFDNEFELKMSKT